MLPFCVHIKAKIYKGLGGFQQDPLPGFPHQQDYLKGTDCHLLMSSDREQRLSWVLGGKLDNGVSSQVKLAIALGLLSAFTLSGHWFPQN